MNAFVSTRDIASDEDLKSLIDQLKQDKRCFFLRWPHKVSGFCRQLPTDFPSPEGQMFDDVQELRWKRQGDGYSVLLLSTKEAPSDFAPVGQTWDASNRDAHPYPKTETRFPRGLAYDQVNVGQRYFRDRQTATVHFVALRVL